VNIYSVGQAAEWLAKQNESKEAVARQLRHYRKRGYVRSRGTFGSGPTATNTFGPLDLGVAKLCRALTGLGIGDEDVMQTVSEACYDLGSSDIDSGGLPGLEAALFRPDAAWSLFIFLTYHSDGSRHVYAQVRLNNPNVRPEHPDIDAAIELPMTAWLPNLAEMQR